MPRVNRWQIINIWTENVIEVPKCMTLNSGPPIKQMKVQILNLKKLKTQIPIGYLTLNFKLKIKKIIT